MATSFSSWATMTAMQLSLVCVVRGVCEIPLHLIHPGLKPQAPTLTKAQLIHGKLVPCSISPQMEFDPGFSRGQITGRGMKAIFSNCTQTPDTLAETSRPVGLEQSLPMWMDEDAALWCILELMEQPCD